jgi:hypothetical protein
VYVRANPFPVPIQRDAESVTICEIELLGGRGADIPCVVSFGESSGTRWATALSVLQSTNIDAAAISNCRLENID